MKDDRDSVVLQSSEPQVSRVAVSGEIDLNSSDELAALLASAASNAPALLEIDLSAVSFMDSQGLHLLLQAHHRAVSAGRRVLIANPSNVVRRLFEVSGVGQVLEVVDDTLVPVTGPEAWPRSPTAPIAPAVAPPDGAG
jgi:anti-sigma B factor antagonist